MTRLKNSYTTVVGKTEEVHSFFEEIFLNYTNGTARNYVMHREGVENPLNFIDLTELKDILTIDTKAFLRVVKEYFKTLGTTTTSFNVDRIPNNSLDEIFMEEYKGATDVYKVRSGAVVLLLTAINRVINRNKEREEFISSVQQDLNNAVENLQVSIAVERLDTFETELEGGYPEVSQNSAIRKIEGFLNTLRRQTDILLSRNVVRIHENL